MLQITLSGRHQCIRRAGAPNSDGKGGSHFNRWPLPPEACTLSVATVSIPPPPVNTAFISASVSTSNAAQAKASNSKPPLKSAVQHAEEVVLLLDSSKFNQASEYFFAEFSDISRIITDSDISAELVEAIHAKGIELSIAR